MPKFSFNRQPGSPVGTLQNANVGEPQSSSAFVPIMSHKVGIEAIIEGLRLSNVEGVELIAANLSTKNVDGG